MKKLFVIIVLLIQNFYSNAQDSLIEYHDGHQWCKFEPAVNNSRDLTKALPLPPFPSNAQITCGAIRVTFMDVYNGTGSGFDDPILGATRRNCVCSAMSYIQSVITFPATINASNPVDILFLPSLNNPASNILGSASPMFPSSFFAGTPGYYSGYVYDYITTGINPAPANTEHGQITMNFGQVYSYCSPTIGNCEYDFESVVIHEMTHLLGIGSMMTQNSSTLLLESAQAPNVFTEWDNLYLYFLDAGGTFNKMVDITTFSANGGINPVLPANMFASGLVNADRIWLTNSPLINHTNQPVDSRVIFTSGTTMSHLDETFVTRTSASPGYSPNYVMNGYLNIDRFKNLLTKEELRILDGLGYTINTTNVPDYSNTPPSLNGNVIEHYFYNYGFPDYPIPAGNSNLIISTTNCNPVTINLSNNTITNGSTTHTLGFFDIDSDPISVFDGQLFNLRGCGNGGNNNNQLVLNGSNDIITYTPRINFIGRAQFAFHLTDGKDRGSYVVITIDVNQDNCFNNGTEHVINGNFEEGMLVRSIAIPNATVTSDNVDVVNHYIQNRFCDGQNYFGSGWQDQVVENSYKICEFGNQILSFPSPGLAELPPLTGDRYTHYGNIENFHQRLAPSLVSCGNYVLEADFSFNLFAPIGTVTTIPFTLRNTINGANLYSNSITLTHTGSGIWHHVMIPISYSNLTPANYVFFEDPAVTFTLIDNLSIYDDPSNPINSPTITITSPNTTICSGSSSTLTASGASTYVWTDISGSTILSTTSSLTVSPTTTTTYLVTGTDAGGCTGTASITVTVNPAPIVSVTSNAVSNTICTGDLTTLTASGALTYSWTPNPTLTPTSAPSITADAVPTITTTYSVTGTAANGCTNTASIIINVNANCCNSPGDISSFGANSSSIGTSFPNSLVYINGNFCSVPHFLDCIYQS